MHSFFPPIKWDVRRFESLVCYVKPKDLRIVDVSQRCLYHIEESVEDFMLSPM